MAVQLGRLFLIQVSNGGWQTIGGMQATSAAFGNILVDATDTTSGGWRQILEDCGNQTLTISGSGIFKGSLGEQLLLDRILDHNFILMRAMFADGTYFQCNILVTKLEFTGAHNGARLYNMTLESTGAVTQGP